MIGIYMYTDKDNGKKYIGQSVNIKQRYIDHKNGMSKSSRPTPFDILLHTKGIDSFSFEVLEECPIEKLDEREKFWIEYYDSYNNGYNYTPGGSNIQGENNPNSKINETTAKLIITDLINTTLTYQQIADKYNTTYSTISNINYCSCWSYLHNYQYNIRKESGITLTEIYSKITKEQASQIIDLLKNTQLTYREIGQQFNIPKGVVCSINTCKTWNKLHNFNQNIRAESLNKKRKMNNNLTEQEVLQIIELLKNSSQTYVDIGRQFGVSDRTITDINLCHTWSSLHNYTNNIRSEAQNKRIGRLSEKDALHIIQLLSHTNKSYKKIAVECQVGYTTVWRINSCKNWTYLHNYKNNIRQEAKLTNK